MSEQDKHNEGSFDRRRRTVLKAVGAGSALSTFASVGAASEHGSGGNGERGDCWCPPCIDRLSGYTALAGDDEGEWPTQPDHVVELDIEPRNVLFQEAPSEETDIQPGVAHGDHEHPQEDFPEYLFDPVGLSIDTGDVVDFYNVSPPEESLHTVTAMTPRFSEPAYFEVPQRIPDDAPPFTSPPYMAEEHWLYKFDVPGVYDLFCLPHLFLGMVMRLVVGEDDFEEPEPDESLPLAVQTVFGAPEMSVENILEQGSVGWDDLTIEEPLDPTTLFEEEE
ncbi:cupredoxin domain-containing protein [Halalkalicoccus ordinarius]|uniref:cupredoxin domain-containing protein n=1 Tax=Halalkalicoccus ordinarius TaxID=3116651 RepID=UPI00300E91E1